MSKKPGVKKAAAKSVDVENYKHTGAKRRMIPTAEQQAWADEEKLKVDKIIYPRNTDLDPQLVWRGKDREDMADLIVDAPPIYIQEKIQPQAIIDRLKRESATRREASADMPDMFADFNGRPADAEARTEFYQHDQNWQNRMILGDSLLVMASLAQKESLRGQVQCIYMDPPYGIKFNSNWQAKTNSREVKDGKNEDISREPEMIRAFRDTWKDGINSYLSYLRDRLVVARDLLTESGSIFVQIGDENVHLVRSLMDEVFGAQNFIATITFKKKKMPLGESFIFSLSDYVIWYGRDKDRTKFRKLFLPRLDEDGGVFSYLQNEDGSAISKSSNKNYGSSDKKLLPKFRLLDLRSTGRTESCVFEKKYEGRKFFPSAGRSWKTNIEGMKRLEKANRLFAPGAALNYRLMFDDYDVQELSHVWMDTQGAADKIYVVQTPDIAIQRMILMTTDPGDLVIDPTCGSGTSAYVAEQWGRRWITIDTSRVALALARGRLMGARFPYYLLRDTPEGHEKENSLVPQDKRRLPPERFGKDMRSGFVYERAPHVTLGSISRNAEIDILWEGFQPELEQLRGQLNAALGKTYEEWEVPRELDTPNTLHTEYWRLRRQRQSEIDASIARNADVELLYDRPYADSKRVRVSGPFTVESLSPHRVVPAGSDDPLLMDALDDTRTPIRFQTREDTDFGRVVIEHLKRTGVNNTKKNETIEFESLVPRAGDGWVSYEGRYSDSQGRPRRAAVAIGPEYDAVGRDFMVRAQKEALRGVFDVLIVCGFQFAPETDETRFDTRDLVVLKARMNQDIRMGNRLKDTGADKLFVVFGEPDIGVTTRADGMLEVEIKGVDIFDPNTGEVRSSADPSDDIACWFIDDDYDEENFFVRHAYFLGNKADEGPYKALKRALKAEIDEDAWASLAKTISFPFARPSSGKICVKVINHFGDEVQKVFGV
jgi:adenine-specific DNA-methyltransferase